MRGAWGGLTLAALLAAPLAALLAAPLVAQAPENLLSYRTLSWVRQRQLPRTEFLSLRAGGLAVAPEDFDGIGDRETAILPTGSLWFHSESLLEEGNLDVYVGPDGALASLYEPDASKGQSGRLDLDVRYLPFYRDGFYRGDSFIPIGSYQGFDYGAFLAFEQRVDDITTLDIGPYYRRFEFDGRADTQSTFDIPGDFNAWGARFILEQSNLVPVRDQVGIWNAGYSFALKVELEENDQTGRYGSPTFRSGLPEMIWRGEARFESYIPFGEDTVTIRAEGGYGSSEDRVRIADAQKPIGDFWVDARLGYRLAFSELTIEPFAIGQFTRTLDEFGVGLDPNFWYGGGLDVRYDLGGGMNVFLNGSYLNNPNRHAVAWENDALGEFQAFAGFEIVF